MSQPSVAAYFTSRKRVANEELRNKNKVRLLGDDEHHKQSMAIIVPTEKPAKTEKTKAETKKDLVARNLLFDLNTKPSRPTRTKAIKSRKGSICEDKQQNIDSMFKPKDPSDGICRFEKFGNLSPKKSLKPQKSKSSKAKQTVKDTVPTVSEEKVEEKVPEPEVCKTPTKEPAIFKTPTKKSIKDMMYDDIKSKVTTSSRLKELRAKIAEFQKSDEKLRDLEQAHKEKKEEIKKNEECVRIKEFERIELEIPASPQKALLSPNKFFSPAKTIPPLSPKASPARRLLFEPKEAPASPVKASPTKTAAYQKYQSLAVEEGKQLPLPYKYRYLAEIFRLVDSVSGIFYNRKEVITFRKLRSGVQEMGRRNFSLDHLAQMKSVWPEAYDFRQEKIRSFGASSSEYELVITPNIDVKEGKSGRCTPDEENVLKSANNTNMCPSVLIERKRKFTNLLLERVKDEHEKFLESLIPPVNAPRNKIARWHAEFDLESCKDIEKADLPKEPTQDKAISAKDVLEVANKMFNKNSRMQKAIAILADIKQDVAPTTVTDLSTNVPESTPKLNSSVLDTPPITPQTQPKALINPALKGIPLSIVEKIRAKQAAKHEEMMTRSTDKLKEAAMYARLPDMAKIVRNIFVSEKKNVLLLEQVVKKLDDSYRTKLIAKDLEEHLKLLCELLPLWIAMPTVRKTKYLKVAKDYDMTKVVHRLEVLANAKA